MLKRLFNWCVPITCIVCGYQSDKKICDHCYSELPWLTNVCTTCGIELTIDCTSPQCGECLIDPPIIDQFIGLFHYANPINSLMSKLKFQKKLLFAAPFGDLLAERVMNLRLDRLPQMMIPVPLHKSRLKKRGFNQALEIARAIEKKLAIPINYKMVKRIKATPPQTLIEADERQQNVKNAFEIVQDINVTHVVIVDDVVTTGSTVIEVAHVLKRHGVQRVDVWCVAKV